MKIKLTSSFTPSDLLERLSRFCLPLEIVNMHKKNVRLCKVSGIRFSLVQNGKHGIIRPLRSFYGKIVEKQDGKTEIIGKFSHPLSSKMKLLTPGLLIVAGAIAISGGLGLIERIIFCGSAIAGVSIVIHFASGMSNFVNAETDAKLLEFLDENIAKGIDPQDEDSTAS